MDTIGESFKSRSQSPKVSAGESDKFGDQDQPAPTDHECRGLPINGVDSVAEERREVVLKINGVNKGGIDGSLWKEPSNEFWIDGESEDHAERNGDSVGGGRNPVSKLIGEFLQRQMTGGGERLLDIDLEMAELAGEDEGMLPPVGIAEEGSHRKDDDSSDDEDRRPDHRRRPSNQRNGTTILDNEVVVRTPNASFRRKPSIHRAKTRSRLLDPPEQPDLKAERVPKSTQLMSGFLGKPADGGDDDDDPFLDDDVPDEFKKGNLNAWTIIQWVSLILIVTALVCSLAVPAFQTQSLWDLPLWKWDVMVLVLICGRLVSGWGIRMIVFLIERNFLLRKRLLYFVYGVRKAVQNCLWLGLVLLSWQQLFDKKIEKETNSKVLFYVTKVLICLLASTLVWLVKTLVVKVLASSFHVSTYFDRIQESIFNQYVIETLSGPPLVEQHHLQEEEETMTELYRLQNSGAFISPDVKAATFPAKSFRLRPSGGLQRSPVVKGADDSKINIDHLNKLNNKNVSAWNMKRLINIVRHGALSTLDEKILDSAPDDDGTRQIRSEIEAKAAARKIFHNVAKPGKKFITWHDILRFMQEEEASKAMSLFEGATESKKISKSALKNWVVNAFRERRALALTLNDTKTAVKKLHNMLNAVVTVVLLIAWLIILQIASSQVLVFISSQFLLVTFIFGNTLKTIFEAIIFLFVMHPFDVGDRCEIDTVQLVVEEMNILNTVFLRYDNLRTTYPNSLLAMKAIGNFYRSPDMGEAIDFCVHIATPTEKIAVMRQRITSYIENKKEHWYPSPQIVLKEVDGFNRLQMAVWLNHRINHQDMGERYERRAQLLQEMVTIFKELDIQYRLLPLDVNVRSFPAAFTRLPPEWKPPAGH